MKSHTGILFTSTLMLGGLVAINSVSALSYESEQGISFTLNPTIRITLSSNAMTINDLAPGSTSDSNIIKVTAESNAIAGYTLSSTVGNSTTYNTTNMVHTNGTNTFTNLSSNKASLAAFDPSTWGYSYAPCTTVECANTPSWISGDITGTTNPGYNGLPLYTTANPIKLINATTPGSSAVQFKFGAKADTAQLAGTYNNVINFIGVGKVITTQYTINYNANGGSGAPAQQIGTSTTGAVQISSTQPTRANYLFKGWCTEQTSDDTCSGETVQPGGMLGLHPGTTNLTLTVARTLYAMWGSNAKTATFDDAFAAAGKTKQGNYYKMQDGTSSICASVTPGQTGTLIDIRDGNTYNVAKLADDNCWMVSNLKLGKGNGETITLDSTDSDLPSGTTFNLKASGRGSSPDATGDCNVGDWYPSDTKQYLDVSHLCINTTTPNYGTYYNWYTAVAGTAGYDTTSGEAPGSICPAGWHLPPNAGNGSYYNLLFTKMGLSSDAASSTIMQQPPTSFLQSGFTYGVGLSYQGTNGFYWSSTAGSNSNAYSLDFNSSYIKPQNIYNTGRGFSVRCLLSS